LLLVFLLFWLGAWFWQGIYFPKNPDSQSQAIFLIKRGEGLRDIALNLAREGLIKSKFFFELFTFVKKSHTNLLAGVYELSPAMNIPEILQKFTKGEVVKEKITIVEGWDLKDIGYYFESKGMSQTQEFFEIAGVPGIIASEDLLSKKDFSEEFEFLKEKPKNISLEGYLFPDTYEIQKDESLEEILRKMLQNFDRKITNDLKEEISHQKKTLFEVLTMASLLEREIKSIEDRQIAAGILWKRLKEGWPLQVDATLTYLTGKGSSELKKEDLAIDSLYNTYKFKGLPIGPICNPGLESIKAALYYKESPYWFYLTTPEGETIFSKTLEEHNINRAKYLK